MRVAALADVLTFYQERIANEGYLRTATERRSILELAREIVGIFYGDEAAQAAEREFIHVFQQHTLPDEMEEMKIAQPMHIADLLIFTQSAKSKNEARRLIDQGGVKIDGEVISGATALIDVNEPKVLQVGKRKFVRLIP